MACLSGKACAGGIGAVPLAWVTPLKGPRMRTELRSGLIRGKAAWPQMMPRRLPTTKTRAPNPKSANEAGSGTETVLIPVPAVDWTA